MAEKFEKVFLEARDEEETETDDLDEEDESEYETEEPDDEQSKHIRTIYIIPNNERKSSEKMTQFELVEAVGIRISQIEKGGPVFVDHAELTNAKDIAYKELFERKNPLTLRRIVKTEADITYVEEWKVREMIYPSINHKLPIDPKNYQKCQ